MAYSPSPQLSPTVLSGGANVPIKSEHPVTPTPPAAPLNKRDRRRNALAERVMDLNNHFSQNRDSYFRQQLQMLQSDMNLIMHADPYQERPLDDLGDELADMVAATFSGAPPAVVNAPGGPQALSRRLESDASAMSARIYATFVEDVNNAMEERDMALTMLANGTDSEWHELQMSMHYKMKFAQEEHKQLSSSLKDRLIQSIGHKRQRLMREKEQLDLADSTALLLHPTQFSITHPSSPGGAQANRKTRNTRHRPDDLDDVGGHAGGERPSKRRRKNAAEEVEAEHATPRMRTADLRASPPREAQRPPTSIYTIDRLFTEKELNSSMQSAAVVTAQYFAHVKAKAYGVELHQDPTQTRHLEDMDDAAGSPGDGSAREGTSGEDTGMAAPEMDRSANASQHATRSGRNGGGGGGASGLHLLGDAAAASQMVSSFGLLVPLHVPSATVGRNGTAPTVSVVTGEDGDDDLAKMERMLRSSAGATDRRLLEQVIAPLTALAPPDAPLPIDGVVEQPGPIGALPMSNQSSSAAGLSEVGVGAVPMSRHGAGSSMGPRMMRRTVSAAGR